MNETRDGRQISPQWLFRPIKTYNHALNGGALQTIMPTTSDVIISYITVNENNTFPLTVTVTIDGSTPSVAFAPVAGTVYYVFLQATSDTLTTSTTVTPFGQVQALYARSFTVTANTTVGNTPNLTATIRYQSL